MGSQLTFQQFKRPTSITVNPMGYEEIGGAMRMLGGTAPASIAWPTSNLVILEPFTLNQTTNFLCLAVANGAAVSGNFDIGIYDDGAGTSTVNRLVSSGSTAQSGTNVPQSVSAAFTLPAGNYYAALCFDNTTATTWAKNASAAIALQGFGYAQVTNGAVTLPSTLTLALMASVYMPIFGPSQRSAV